jgi:hypothetical protein
MGSSEGPPWSELPGEGRVVRVPFLEERIPAFLRLFGAVRESRCFPGKELLSNEALIGQVERVLQHLLGCRTLGHDLSGPLQSCCFEFLVRDDGIDHAHVECVLGAVVPSQKEDLSRPLLADLACEQC